MSILFNKKRANEYLSKKNSTETEDIEIIVKGVLLNIGFIISIIILALKG